MLNAAAGRQTEAHRGRYLPPVAVLWPTARVSRLGASALTMALAVTPLVVAVVRGARDVTAPLVLVFLAAGANLAWATEDPAANLLDSLPVSSPKRATTRLFFASMLSLAGIAAALITDAAWGPSGPNHWTDRLPELSAAAAIATAVGFAATRRGERAAGPVGFVSGMLGTAVVAMLAFRFPRALPSFMASPTHTRWWFLAAIGLVVSCRAGRDPASPRRQW